MTRDQDCQAPSPKKQNILEMVCGRDSVERMTRDQFISRWGLMQFDRERFVGDLDALLNGGAGRAEPLAGLDVDKRSAWIIERMTRKAFTFKAITTYLARLGCKTTEGAPYHIEDVRRIALKLQ